MNDFQRYMDMQGVRPLTANGRPAPPVARDAPSQAAPRVEDQPQSQPANLAYWANGTDARETLEHALARVKSAEDAWMLGIGQGGETVNLDKRNNAASLIATADRMKLKLIVMGAQGWSSIFHPGMGAATLDRDPA